MDIDSLQKGIALFGTAVTALRQVIEMLPDSSQKANAAQALEQAEKKLKIAEAETAQQLGFELCRAHFPPGIMTTRDGRFWTCPVCNLRKDSIFG